MDSTPYDIFLSHNSRDKPAVERIALQLRQAGFTPWLDAWDLPPGGDWQDGIEQGLRHSHGCAVFLGAAGFGDWQIQEMKVASDLAVHDAAFRYFLVLLPSAPDHLDPATLPAFISLRGWVDLRQGFTSPRQLQPLFNAVLGLAMGPSTAAEPELAESPYRGLAAFDEEHAEFFFGREAEIRKLLEKLRDAPFLAVIGPSGSGKSSLVLAGLLPAVRHGRLEGSAEWPLVTMVPGAHPVESLAVALDSLDLERSRNRLLEELRGSPLALRLEVGALLRDRPRDANLVLVVDQCEEIFTLCRDEAEREAFLALLLEAASPDGHCLVIITMRADFYPRITEYPALADQVASHQLLVGALTREGLSAAIEQPAFRQGLRFEPGLVSTMLADVGSDAGALPLLQYALDELWKRQHGGVLTLEGYRASGGVGDAIATRANAVFEGLPPDQQVVARRVLLRLTQPGESTEDTRRRAELDELVTRPAERPAIEAAINALVAARLLTASRDEVSGAAQVDVAHEALIRAWPRLRQWLDDDRQGLLVHRRLTEAAQEWQRSARDADLLYRGTRLAEALALATLQSDALNELEREFLAESDAWRERDRAAATAAAEARERLRRRVLTGLAAFAVVALLLALLAGWQWREAGRQAVAAGAAQATAQSEAARAESEADIARAAETLSLSRQLAAQSLIHTDDLDLGLLLAAEAYTLQPDDLDVRRGLLSTVQEQPSLERVLSGFDEPIRTLAFSPDGQTLVSGSDNGTVRLWDLATGTSRESISTGQGGVWSLAFRDDGRQFAVVSIGGTARLGASSIQFYNSATGASEGHIDAPADNASTFVTVAYRPDGEILASASGDGTIELWDPATGAAIGPALTGHEGDVLSLVFSDDGRTLLSAGVSDDTVRFWDVDETGGRPQGEPLAAGQGGVYHARFSPDGAIVATAGADGTIRLWETASRLAIGDPLSGHEGAVGLLTFSTDGAGIFSGGTDGTIRYWDIATRQSVGEPKSTGQRSIFDLALTRDGKLLASGGSDGTIRLWNTGTAASGLFDAINGHKDFPEAVAYSADGSTIATGDASGAILVWDAVSGTQIGGPLRGHAGGIVALDFSSNGRLLASASVDATVRLWNMDTRQPVGVPLVGHNGTVNDVTFSPTGGVLASGGSDGTVRRWRTSDGAAMGDPLAALGSVYSVSFSPSGDALAAAIATGTIALWDTASGAPIGVPMPASQGAVTAIRFVQEGMLVSGGADGTLRYWDVADRTGISVSADQQSPGLTLQRAVKAHDGPIWDLEVNADGTQLASAGQDGRVLLWAVGGEVPTARLLDVGYEWLPAVDFSLDGSRLAFSAPDANGEDVLLTLWNVNEETAARTFLLQNPIDAVLSVDGSKIISGGRDGRVVVWDATNGDKMAEQQTPDAGGVRRVASSPDGSHVALGSRDGVVRLWDGSSSSPIGPALPGQGGSVTTLTYSADGQWLAAGSDDGTVRLWDTATGNLQGRFVYAYSASDFTAVQSLAFSADNAWLAVGGFREIALWDVEAGQLRDARLIGHEKGISAVAFSPDGRLFASGSEEGVVRLWDVATWQPFGSRLDEASGEIEALTFSPDSALLAAGTADGDTHVWQLSARFASPLGGLGGATGARRSQAFTADGAWLASIDDDGVLSRWDLTPETWLRQACAVANRNLTRDEWQIYIDKTLPDSKTLPYHKTCPALPGPGDGALASPVATYATPVST